MNPALDETILAAIEHHKAGRFAEAEDLYRQALASEPNHPVPWHLLGLLAHQNKDSGLGAQLVEHALSLRREMPEALANLSAIYAALERLKDSENAAREALRFEPENKLAQLNLAVALCRQKRFSLALEVLEPLSRSDPRAEVFHNLSLAYFEKFRTEEAIAAARRMVREWPESEDGYTDLANALQDLGTRESITEAIAVIGEQNRRWPERAGIRHGLTASLQEIGEYEKALDYVKKAVELDRECPVAHFNLSLMLLLAGDYEKGWEEYEWRLARSEIIFPWHLFREPIWRGEPLEGKTLMVCAEQGFGDTIQFARFLPALAHKGAARMYMTSKKELMPLLRLIPRVGGVFEEMTELPKFDYYLPMGSLARVFKVRLDSIPVEPLISMPEELVKEWGKRLEKVESREGRGNRPIRVGLCWNGSLRPFRGRSMPLAALAELGKVPGVVFHSLQKGPAARDAERMGNGWRVIDHCDELSDFAQTGGLIANLDLVISIDTAAAHMAAAMGTRTWIMLPLAPDWRWRHDREDCAWYPSARLFRQKRFGDWAEVVGRVAEELRRFAAGAGS